jgi:hypothetical protein
MPVNISVKDLSIIAAVSGVTTLSVRFILFLNVFQNKIFASRFFCKVLSLSPYPRLGKT